jgi:heat shock protein HslJ
MRQRRVHGAKCGALAGADEVKFGPLAATKMYCQPAQAIEDQYLAALGSVARWTVEADALTLSSDTDPVLRFRELTPTRRVH